MSENLMSSDHKATNKKSRACYDGIKWNNDGTVRGLWGQKVTKTSDANQFFNIFVKTK